jgi:hypothetical protein
MTVARATLLAVLASLTLAAGAEPVVASGAIGSLSTPVEVQGSVQVEFAASAAAGCVDSCDASGSLSWDPIADAQLEVESSGQPGRARLNGALVFFGGLGQRGPTTTSHVIRARTDSSSGVCSDARSSDLLVFDFSVGSESHIEARLARGKPDDSDIFSTRCGGPVESDFLGALPSASLDRRTLLRGRTAVDLSGTRPFAAHGFAGTVRSSLVLHLGRPRRESPVAAPATPPRLAAGAIRTVTATYAIERIGGDVQTAFGSVGERSLCDPLDVCGATGSIRLQPLVSSGSATFVAYGPARRVTGHGLRAALGLAPGRRPRGVTALGTAEWTRDSGRATETFTDGFGKTCRDSVQLGGGFMTFWVGPRRVFAGYGRGFDSGADPFRTRCQGPSLVDASQEHPLAAGNVPRKAFRGRQVVIPLDRGRPFESEPYRGETRPAVTVVLRRLKVRQRVDYRPVGVL